MREFLGVDAGGTSTRAVLVDVEGRCLGYGRAAGGNPTSAGSDPAAAAVGDAVAQALTAADGDPASVEQVLVAHAGGHADYQPGIERRLAALGVAAGVSRAGDLLALFASGTPETEGAALISGTGAIGGAIRDGRLVRTVDGTGWLLGDSGSGFWIGHLAARAVVDDLDGGPATALTPAILRRLDLQERPGTRDSRPIVLSELIHRLYALRPVQLSMFAPLVFELSGRDPIADGILRGAVDALTRLLHRVRTEQPSGPLVFGGSVLVQGVLSLPADLVAPLLGAAGGRTPATVDDGLVGAAVLALRTGGVEVTADRFDRLRAGIGEAAAAFAGRQARA